MLDPDPVHMDMTTVRRAFDRTLAWLGGLRVTVFVPVVLVASFIAKAATYKLYALFDGSIAIDMGGPQSFQELDYGKMLLAGVVLAPVVETVLTQTLPIWLVHGKLKRQLPVAVAVSGLLFAAMHIYSVGYVVMALGPGLVFAVAYASQLPRGRRATWLVSLSHALHNGVLVVLLYYFP